MGPATNRRHRQIDLDHGARAPKERNDMKPNRWSWFVTLALGLVVATALALTIPHAPAMAQPAPAPPDQIAPPGADDDDAPPPGDVAWLGLDDDGPDGGPMEAPHGGPRGGWMGAGPGGMGPGHRGVMGQGMRRGRMGAAMRMLDLTPEQKKRMADIRDRQERSAIRAQADMRIAQLDLRKLMRADTPDRRAIESQIDKLGGMRTAMQKSRMGMMFDMRSVLTQEQRDKLKDWRQNGGPRGEERGSSDSD
jgi:Spy/CpxP family protein refolding chaperone